MYIYIKCIYIYIEKRPICTQETYLQTGSPKRSDVQLSERLESLGIMGEQERVPLNPWISMITRGSRGTLLGPPLCRETSSVSGSQCKCLQSSLPLSSIGLDSSKKNISSAHREFFSKSYIIKPEIGLYLLFSD